MTKLRIAFIGARGVVGTYSGIETYYEEIGSRLVGLGHEVTAYCRTHFTPAMDHYRGIRVRRIPSINTKHLDTISHSVLSTLDAVFRDYDVIQYHAIGSSALSALPRILGKKTVVSVRGLDWQRGKWGRFARQVLVMGEKASAICPSATVVVSETLSDHFQTQHNSDVVVIPNAIPKVVPRSPDRLRELGVGKREFILFAGRLSPEKGLDSLLRAFRSSGSEKKLLIAGGGSYSPEYQRQVEELATDQVLFLGNVDRSFMEELYSNCYAFVLPSLMEGLSVALLESLGYGNCIITSNIPENREVVGDTAVLVEPSNDQDLCRALSEILGDPTVAQEYRDRALARAQGLPDWDEVARRTEQLYMKLSSRPSS